MAIWHIFSNGTRADIPFNTDADKTFAWNSVALCAHGSNVVVLVATVNDTHLHTLVTGDAESAECDRVLLQTRLQRFFPEDNISLACEIVEGREKILSKFMYVYRNCLDFYRKLPGEYPWGSGNIYFSEKRHFYEGERIGLLPVRMQREVFKTKKDLPDEWMLDKAGRILPESFIDYASVEQMFGSVRAFIAFLYVRKEDEARMKQEVRHVYLEQRKIQDLRRIANTYCKNLCGHSLKTSPLEVRLKAATRMLKEGLSGRTPSLAKALFLTPDDLRLLV